MLEEVDVLQCFMVLVLFYGKVIPVIGLIILREFTHVYFFDTLLDTEGALECFFLLYVMNGPGRVGERFPIGLESEIGGIGLCLVGLLGEAFNFI